MIERMVKAIMSNAMLRFAKNEGVSPIDISIVITTKTEDYAPVYYYTVKNETKMENGQTKYLDFNLDLLDKKWDILGQEAKAAFFLSKKFEFFEKTYEENGIKANELFLVIKATDETATDFYGILCHNKKGIKKFSLEEIFNIG